MREDTVLLQLAQKNPKDARAFEEIFRKYERLIYFIARRYFRSHEDVMDASQETAIKIYNALPRVKLPEDGSLKAWICTVTARVCLDSLRKRRVVTTELTEEIATSPLPSAESDVIAAERSREVLDAIKNLPGDHRMVIILRDMQGLPYDQIADILKVSVGTVKSRISRARGALKKALFA